MLYLFMQMQYCMVDDKSGLLCAVIGFLVGAVFYVSSIGNFGDLTKIHTGLQIISGVGFVTCIIGVSIICYNHFGFLRIFQKG